MDDDDRQLAELFNEEQFNRIFKGEFNQKANINEHINTNFGRFGAREKLFNAQSGSKENVIDSGDQEDSAL